MMLNNLVQRLSADIEKLAQGYETAILSAAILLSIVVRGGAGAWKPLLQQNGWSGKYLGSWSNCTM